MNLVVSLFILSLPIGEVRVLPSSANANFIGTIAGFSAGVNYDESQVAEAIRKLYQTGYYDYVAIDTSLVDSTVQVTIQVEQPSRLERLEIVGNRKIKTNNLLKEIAADSDAVLSARQIFDWERKVREQYKKKNYLLAKVSTKIIESDKQGYSIARLEIEEGKGVHISTISFTGNNSVQSIRLERLMKNRPKWFILRSGRFDDQKFKKDIETIEAYYHDKGWIDAKVTETELPIDTNGQLDIVIHVDEGKRYYTGEYSFQGREALPESTLVKAVVIEKTKPYSLSMSRLSVDRIRRAYWEEGYIYASVDPIETLKGDTVDIAFSIVEGQPAKVRRIIIKGNQSVRDNAIRREITLLPGSVFKYSKVERSQRNIMYSGLFSDVRFYPEDVEGEQGTIDLVFVVQEKPSGQFSVGVTYAGKEQGLLGNVGITHPNVFGGGQNGYLQLEKGTSSTQASLGLTEPWLFDTPTSLGGEMHYKTEQKELYDAAKTAYKKTSLGGSISASRPLPLDYTRGGLTFAVDRVFIDSVSKRPFPNDPILGFDPLSYPKTTISTTFNLVRDSRDNFSNPSSGSLFNQSIELAGGPLGGDISFIKENLDIQFNFPVAWEKRIVLTQKMRLGYITGLRSSDTIPIYERYRPGGTSYDGFVRGYDDYSLGTVVNGALIGGRAMAVFNTELKVKITPQIAIIGFFDAGSAWESLDQVNLSELNKGTGLGIRFEIAYVGVLGFDAGFGLDYPEGTPLSEIFHPHFQISRSF